MTHNRAVVVVTRSGLGYPQTAQRLLDAIQKRGLTVFARIDHAAAARDVGLQLGAEEVVVFGNPRAGTPLMQGDPRIGLELPLRILLWEEGGEVFLGYRDPRELAAEYNVADRVPILDVMSGLLAQLAAEAAG